jgi:hypothetical protein
MYSVSDPNLMPVTQALPGTVGGGGVPPPGAEPNAGGVSRGKPNELALVIGAPPVELLLKPADPAAKGEAVGEFNEARPNAPAPVNGCRPNNQLSPGTAQDVLVSVTSRGM